MNKVTRASAKSAIKKADLKSYVSLNKKLVLLLPYLAIAGVLIVFPMVMLLTKALDHTGGDNAAIVKQSSTWEIMGRSVYLGLAAAAISLLIAFPFAYIVGRSKSKAFRLISIALLLSPLFVFTISKIFSLKILLLLIFENPEKIKNEFVMVLGMVYLYMPFMIVPLYSVLQQMPASLLEASKDLGYGRISSIVRVVVPYALKAIFSGLAIVFMMSATSLAISGALLKDVKELKMIGNVMDDMAAKMRTNDLSSAQGSTLALVTIGVMMGVYGALYLIPLAIRKLKGGVNA